MYIFGPCSAETREQVLETARLLKEECGTIPFIYRAGVWKPRTSPDTFQGAGEEALGWLMEVKETYGLRVATEVATPDHVRTALFAGIDYLWIGARTGANPITVQTIADTIRKTKRHPKGVLVKNPVSEDAALWLGNIERMEQTGVPVIAVHRGCNHQPCWSMAHALRIAKPELPLLIDPSHMSGKTDKIAALLSKAAELGYDGSMIEIHCDPSSALSDAKQQLTPAQYRAIMQSILDNTRDNSERELRWLRAEIDELDDRLWDTIAARMDVSRRIGEWKKTRGMAPLQPQRYQEILSLREQWADQHGLSREFAKELFDTIHAESVKRQE